MATSQWERLLKNQGVWVGSFAQFTPAGDLISDTPSVVTLKALDGGNLMRQEIRQSPPGTEPKQTVLEYRSLARSVLFFENGAFSQGSIQWGPLSDFGAELGLIAGDERLRVVSLFDKQSHLAQVTLIREHREGTPVPLRSPLALADGVGLWEGQAVTLYPDLRPAETQETRLEVTYQEGLVTQTRSFRDRPPHRLQGRWEDNRILFRSETPEMQLLMLPGGVSLTCPLQIQPRYPFFLEVGWLLAPGQHQRMIRQYTAQGGWHSLTLITECKSNP